VASEASACGDLVYSHDSSLFFPSLGAVALRVKGARAFLVSDSVASAAGVGAPTAARGPGGELLLAGSVHSLADGFIHVVASGLTPLAEAWDMASLRPRRVLSLRSDSVEGSTTHRQDLDPLRPGAPADLTLFWESRGAAASLSGAGLKLAATYVRGVRVYQSDFKL
jgi:N-acetylglucosamine-6-phosphate deacetylase